MCLKWASVRLYLLLTIGLISSFLANSQKAEIGIRFLTSFSKFDLKNSEGNVVQGEVNFNLGMAAVVGYSVSEHAGIQAELIVNSISQTYTESDVERKISLTYLNIPLLISLNTGKSKLVNLNIVAGPQIGINVASGLLRSGSGINEPNAILSVKKGDFAFAYGAGLDFALRSSDNLRVCVGFRGVLGLLNIGSTGDNLSGNSYFVLDETDINSNSAYLGLSFLF